MADWKNSGVLGTLVYWPDVRSEFLSETHHVEVWLPPDYDDDPERNYKVIYMQDGQNLFDPRITEYGIDWGVDEAIVSGVNEDQFESVIVVGIWNTPQRFSDYSPWDTGPQYARFIIEELMPRVNAEFRTLQGPRNTFAMGSSMGGLLSFYLVKDYPDIFGACGCLSSHFSLSDAFLAMIVGKDPAAEDSTPYIVSAIADGYPAPTGGRFFFDYGTKGLDADYSAPHAVVRDWLIEHDLVEGEDFVIREYPGADHNNASWRARLGDQLSWLLAGD
jgi:enterochelin esterase-like enzyme